MSSDDIKLILRKFYVTLRRRINPEEIVTEIDGLTDFDIQQIKATTRNDGQMLGNDKLLDTLGRRTTRTFVSFVKVLHDCQYLDLAGEIIAHTKEFFPHLHTSIEYYALSQRTQVPSATVRPSVAAAVYEKTSYVSRQQQSFSPRLQDAPSSTVREEETRSTYTNRQTTFQSFHRTTEVTRQVNFTTDTLIEDVPNIVFKKWARELNVGDNWNRLGDVIQLTRKQMKEIKNSSDPGEEILDFLGNKEQITVEALMHLLESAGLPTVLEVVKQSLEPSTVSTDQTCTQIQTNVREGTQQPVTEQSSVDRHGIPESPSAEDIKRMNISDDSLKSNTDNENQIPLDELPTTGAEVITKTLINNLNTTSMKFDAVKTVHIYLNNEKDKTVVTDEENIETPETTGSDKDVSSEENITPSPVAATQTDPLMDQSEAKDSRLDSADIEHVGLPGPKIHTVAMVTDQSMPVEDQQPSLFVSCLERQIKANPTESLSNHEYHEKTLEQERAALSRDFQNQPNLESFRDIQNSIPETERSRDIRESVFISPTVNTHNTATRETTMLQHQEDAVDRGRNTGKNSEQELEALRRDFDNQLNMES